MIVKEKKSCLTTSPLSDIGKIIVKSWKRTDFKLTKERKSSIEKILKETFWQGNE